MTTDLAVPNHHHGHPAFAGLTGVLAAASMTVGRDGDARLAAELARLAPGDVVLDIGCGPGVAAVTQLGSMLPPLAWIRLR